MTKEQEKTIEKYRLQVEENCTMYQDYSSSDICKVNLYESTNPDDKNITIRTVTVTGTSDDFQPYIEVNTILVEPDGNAFRMTDVYPTQFVNEYVDKLKKIK